MLWRLSRIYNTLWDTKKHADSTADDTTIFKNSFKTQCFWLADHSPDPEVSYRKMLTRESNVFFQSWSSCFGYIEAVQIPNATEFVKAVINV